MTNSSAKYSPRDPLPSPYLPDGVYGLFHLPRLLEKLRRQARGELEAYYQPTLGQGFDRMLAEHLGRPWSVWAGIYRTGCEEWVEVAARLRRIIPAEVAAPVWNRRLVQRGLSGYGHFRLERRKAQLGWQDREDIRTMIDLIEEVEGR